MKPNKADARPPRHKDFPFSSICGIVRPVRSPDRTLATVGSRMTQTAVGLVLGILLLWQGVFTSFAKSSAPRTRPCCCRGCDSDHCSTPACCAKPGGNRAPLSPAASSANGRTEWHAVATFAPTMVPAFAFRPDIFPRPARACAFVTAVPLFQRDCSYIL